VVIPLEDWSEIRVLHRRDGLSKREIARRLGISRVTVDRALASDRPPRYERPSVETMFTSVEPAVRELLKSFPAMPTTVIAERVGWVGSVTNLRRHVRAIRPDYAPVDPADRLDYRPGDQAQCDLWFPPVKIPLGHGQVGTPPVLVMVPSFSRFITARMIPTRTTADLLAGMWSLLLGLGGVPGRLLWDNEAGIGRGRKLTLAARAFAGTLATQIVLLKAFDPESKGIAERANGFMETSFMPGRTFTSAQDFNGQLEGWLPGANSRTVRRINARPVDVIGLDRAAMVDLPPVAPTVGFTDRVRLPRDYYVRVLGNDYSVDPRWIGRFVDVAADLESVTVSVNGLQVTRHDRCWATGRTITDPEHVQVAKGLRTAFSSPRAPIVGECLDRDLADYDTAFGVSLDDRSVTA
jgi:transposase